MSGQVSDSDRKKLEGALAAALLLIYRGKAIQAMKTLKQELALYQVPSDVQQKIEAFAAQRAQLAQDGINHRLDKAQAESDAQTAVSQATDEIKQYNASVLIPFLTSWASHQAQHDVYTTVEVDGQKAIDTRSWVWTQDGSYPDDCRSAADASPAPYKNLVDLAGGTTPPAHPRCRCQLYPAE